LLVLLGLPGLYVSQRAGMGRLGWSMLAILLLAAAGFATDNVLAEHFPVRLTGRWRFVLAGGALTGWLVASPSSPQELR
jgi:hypothetical protein